MRYLILICFAGSMFGQGTETKRKPDDYEAHGQAGSAAIGAEFTVHSFSRGEQSYIAQDYLVVEVALFPAKGETLAVENGSFQLRLNGKKQLLQPQPATMVAADLQHPEWQQPGGVRPEIGGSLGNVGVIMGGPPRNNSPFPGSNPPGSQAPQPVPIPKDNPSGLQKEPPVKAEELVVQTALVEGPHHAAFSGFLYFPFKGKISSIKSLELLYEDAVLKLR
jgi:hypothetical protein